MTARLSPDHPLPSAILAQAQRILVVKLDGVGDFVLVTPFLRGLRASAPKAHISLVVLPGVVPLTIGCPHVDCVVAPQGDLWSGKLNFQGRTPDDLKAFAGAFRAGFDVAVVPRFDLDNKGAAPLITASRAPVRVGFSETVNWWKTDANRGFDAAYTHVLDDPTPRHETEQNARLLTALGGTPDRGGPELYLDAAERAAARHRIAEAFGGVRPSRVLGVVATSAGARRDYPPQQLATLLSCAVDDGDDALLVLEAPHDRGVALELVNRLRGANACLLPATDSIRDVAAAVTVCDALIAPDTGPAHIAAAAGIPVVVLSCHPADGSAAAAFSPVRYRPLGDKVLWLQPAHALAPCTDMCTADHAHCITGIDPQDAAARIRAFLSGGS